MAPLDPPSPPSNRREELNELLVGMLGSRHVYFQPDDKVRITYPAIVYGFDDQNAIYANNGAYRRTDAYQLTLIDRNPDVPIRKIIESSLPVRFVRAFAGDGLNHLIYSLYF